MSEAEIKRRLEYKENRKKWMTIQIVAIILISVIALGSFVIYNRMNQTYYIEYTESGNIDYKVQLSENEFFDEEWLESDRTYITSLIKNVLADFEYELNMDTDNVGFDYSYRLDAKLLVIDNTSGIAIYDPTYELIPETTKSINNARNVKIREQVNIDYVMYNEIAEEFIEVYDLKNAHAILEVKLLVDVISRCEEFEENSENSYSVALNIPLAADTFNINMNSSVPTEESKVLACSGRLNQNVFKALAIVFAILDVIFIAVLIVFAYLTRNEDINYTIKVQKLVSAYRSYIQEIENDFDTDGYQLIYVKTFNEMLSIRDTIQSPILMYENGDKTCTKFVIPTNTKVLYTFEIKVENYDELYGFVEPEPELVFEPEPEPEIIAEVVDEEALAEALETPDVVLEEIEYVEIEEEITEDGVEVIGVVWPERAHKNKIYRYDPDGAKVNDGDIVLVPSRDVHRNKEIIRKAAVAHGNHRVDPESLHHPLKKIIGIVKRRAEMALTPDVHEEKQESETEE